MSKRQLLLVDGDAKSLSVMEVSLRNAGFTVTTAINGADALEKISLAAPELVLSDTIMPEVDGFELCRRMKAEEKLAKIPFLFLTGQKAVADKVRGLELGADDYLTKPIYIKEVVTRVKLALQRYDKELLERKGPMAEFTGNLADMGLADLTQTMEQSRKSGILHVRVPGRDGEGTVWFREGKVVDAQTGRWTGDTAFFRLLTANEGAFTIDFGAVDRADHILLSSQGLLLEGMRRVDERGRLLEQIPAPPAVFELDYGALVTKLPKIPDQVDGLLKLFDGKRSIQEVLDDSPFDELTSLNLVAKLYFEGLLKEVAAAPAAAAPPVSEVERWAAERAAAATPSAELVAPVPASPELPQHGAWFAAPEESAVSVRLPESNGAPAPMLLQTPLAAPEPMSAAPIALQLGPGDGAAQALAVGAEDQLPEAAVVGAEPPYLPIHPLHIVHYPSERRSARPQTNGVPAAEASYFDQPQTEEPTPIDLIAKPVNRAWTALGGVALMGVTGVVVYLVAVSLFTRTPATATANPKAVAAPALLHPPTPPGPAAPPPAPPAAGAQAQEPAPPPPVATPTPPAPTVAAPTAKPQAPAESYEQALAAGEARYRRGAIKGAIAEFHKAVAARPDSDVALAALGNALYEAGQTATAERPLKRALEINPKNSRACLTLGTLYQTAGDRPAAAMMYQKYLDIDPHGEFAGDVRTILKSLR